MRADHALAVAYSAARNHASLTAVELALCAYNDLAGDELPIEGLAKRLEVDPAWALGPVVDYMIYGL